MSDQNLQIIVPAGMFGANEFDTALDTFLRDLGKKFGAEDEWPAKYGTNVENEIFLMHRYCWCEKDDCPWCGGCDCPEENVHYFIDGTEVTYKEYVDFYDQEVYQKVSGGKVRSMIEWYESRLFETHREELDRAADEANKRRVSKHDPVCDYCLGKGIFAQFGGDAPNFWYKPLDFKVTWYKYIGRITKTSKQLTIEEFERMRLDCLSEKGLSN